MHGERRDPWFLTFAPPQQWGRCRDRRFTPSSDEAVGNRRLVERIVRRGPLDLEARRVGARLAARPRRFQALEGSAAPGGAGAQRLRRDDLGVHGFCCARSQATGLPPPVGLPPQRGRGSHECPAARMLAAAWRPGYSGRYSRSHLRRSALHTTMAARGTAEDPRGPVLRAVPAGAAGRSIARGDDDGAVLQPRRHRRDPTTGETGTKLLIES